ncbi:hypothetical protein ACFJGW_19960 [Burkholderiaceae bacterium UC74_6]
MIDEVRLRKLELKTRNSYVRAVRKLAAVLKRSPDAATEEDRRKFRGIETQRC